MMIYSISALSGLCVFGIVWFLLDRVKIKAGWQNRKSSFARFLDNRRRVKFNEQLPEALATMSNALRAGFSISQAFDSVVEQKIEPMSAEFEILQKQLRVGMPFEDALTSMSDRVGSDDLTLVTTAILVSRKSGGNVTEIFDKISATIRERARIERKIRSLTAQGRMQGVIVSLMPVFLGIAITMLKPKMMGEFFCSAVGAVSILAMVLLIAAGWLMIRRIIKIEV